MKIFIGSDHAGFELKEKLISFLKDLEYEVEDKGAYSLDPQDDYPDFVKPVTEAVANNPEHNRGIVIGKSGQGEAMCANKFKGVRAALFYGGNEDIVKLSRQHNDANVLSLSAELYDRVLPDKGFAKESISSDVFFHTVKIWLETPFSGDERHVRRIKKLDA